MKKTWLELATHTDRPNLMKPHGCAASDGTRMHIENANGACQCGDDKQHKAFDNVIKKVKDTPFAFAVNRQYLLDALSGINLDGTVVLFFMTDSKSPIVIQDPDGEQTAIVMPMHIGEKEKIKNLPYVAPVKVSDKPRRYALSQEVE
jgi:hypothetical protein